MLKVQKYEKPNMESGKSGNISRNRIALVVYNLLVASLASFLVYKTNKLSSISKYVMQGLF